MSRRVSGAVLALCASAALHGLGFSVFVDAPAQLEGGGERAPMKIGTSFADLVVGSPGRAAPDVVEPLENQDVAEPTVVDIETPPSERPNEAEPQTVTREESAVEPATTVTASPNAISPTSAAARPAAQSVSEPVGRTTPDFSVEPPVGSAALAARPADTVQAAAEPVPQEPASRETALAASPEARLAAPEISAVPPRAAPPMEAQAAEIEDAEIVPDDTADQQTEGPQSLEVSLRPMPRPPNLEPPRRAPRTAPPPPAAASGNAAQNAARGNVEGTQEGQSVSEAPQAEVASPQGDAAAVTNYPGQVLRHLSLQRIRRIRHRGDDAIVQFTIAPDGALASLRLVQSSGNEELDEAAKALISGAAPFPPPPAGAQTRFNFDFGGQL